MVADDTDAQTISTEVNNGISANSWDIASSIDNSCPC